MSFAADSEPFFSSADMFTCAFTNLDEDVWGRFSEEKKRLRGGFGSFTSEMIEINNSYRELQHARHNHSSSGDASTESYMKSLGKMSKVLQAQKLPIGELDKVMEDITTWAETGAVSLTIR